LFHGAALPFCFLADIALIPGRQYGRAAELRDAGLRGQEEAHQTRRASSRDGGGGAVVSAGSSDRAALYDIQSMRAFCTLELGRDPIPDETTILNFRLFA